MEKASKADDLQLNESEAMDQPTAEEALKRLEPLVGEWTLEAKPP